MTNPLTQAAAFAAGACQPGQESAWLGRVKALAIDLSFMDSEIEATLAAIADAKVFSGTIVSVAVDEKSTRGNILIYTGTDKVIENLPAGHERLQTDRGDTPDGAAMIARTQALVNHKVTVWRVMERIESTRDRSFRKVVRVVDNGPDSERTSNRGSQQNAPADRSRPQAQTQQPQSHQAQRNERHLQSVPGETPAGNAPAAPRLEENTARQRVLNAAGGDRNAATRAWEHIGNPSGPVLESDVTRAIAFLGQAS